jgi:hypothetical protein
MKKSFLLIAILAAVLIFPFAINVEKAGADAIMFPWIVQSSTISTLVSVVNTAQGNPDFEERVHLQYWMKNPNGAHPTPDVNDQENTCTELDFKVIVSKDDMFTFDTSGKLGNGLPLFGDANTVPVSVNSLDMNADGARRAFLLVDNNTAQNFVQVGTNVDGTLYGEAIVLEIGSGAAWGYIAYNPSGGLTSTQSAAIVFNDGLDLQGEVIGATEITQTTLMPIRAMNTKFFLTPVDVETSGVGENQGANQRVGNTNTKIQLCIDPADASQATPNSSCQEAGIYDNEEGPVSSSVNKNIVCTSADDLEALMGGGFTSFRDTNGQGWAYVVTNRGDVDRTGIIGDGAASLDNPSTDMIIGRLEYVSLEAFGFGGTVNNFAWLRDNATVAGTGGINGIHNCPFVAGGAAQQPCSPAAN